MVQSGRNRWDPSGSGCFEAGHPHPLAGSDARLDAAPVLITWKVAALLRACYPGRWLSIEKLTRHLASHLTGVKKLESLADYLPDPRHIQIGRRKGWTSLVESTFIVLG